MLSPKNLTPRQLSFLAALAISTPTAFVIYLLNQNWIIFFISFALLTIISFSIIVFTFNRFIYRKIKLIYKIIYNTKATKKEEIYHKYLLPQKNIKEVTADVEAWATEKTQEIEILQKNEQFRKEFLQNLSHEFKTPVFAIQGYVESLLDGGMLDPEINKRFLNNTSKNIERLTNLILDLDEISKLESGEIVIAKTNFVVQELIKEVFESLSLKMINKNITAGIKKGCEAPLFVFADKEKIKQVFINLIDNAIKYGKPGGIISASIYTMDEMHILIEISDDGIGIPEIHIPRIFERFYRTDAGRSRDVAGSGLGLSICKHIIEAHNQNIHVRSSEGVGTTIGFTLEGRKD